MKRFRTLITMAGILATLLLATTGVFALNITQELCDDIPKYYCSRVQWDPSGGGTLIYFREHKGGRDGGAQKWQIFWTYDFTSDGSTWTRVGQWGAGPWRTNIDLSGWFRNGTDNTTYANTDVAVMQKVRFEETIPGQTYTWCSENLTHYLNRGFSQKEGTGACNT